METQTIYEVAAEFRCRPRKVSDVARRLGVGAQLGGSAGWRFTEADKRALWDAMRPAPKVPVRKHRKTRRTAA